MTEIDFKARCPVCDEVQEFSTPNEYWQSREKLKAAACPQNGCVPRDRAIGAAILDKFTRQQIGEIAIHEAAFGSRGMSRWVATNASDIVLSGFFPDKPFGSMVGRLRNENLESQTFEDERFDLVFHLDVMEHLFNPFQALAEIHRTLKPGGYCMFTAPTYPERERSEQVAWLIDGELKVTGEPEYHGNPQSSEGSLVTWRYGYDFPFLICRDSPFEHVEVRRWHSRANAVMGRMTEVYILQKSDN